MKKKALNRYQALIERIFMNHWKKGSTEFPFLRQELESAAKELGFESVKNVGDVAYSFRYRHEFPPSILMTQPKGKEWIIEGIGKGKYKFKLVRQVRIVPRTDLMQVTVPDSTPEIIREYAMDDEQALLAILRYNRLIDIFLGLTTYSLQNHLRTTVQGIGQIEIDELYVGLDTHGCHYVIPVQAKSGRDHIGIVQTTQDISFVTQKFPRLRCRAIAAQFMDGGAVALFELALYRNEIKVVQERHYKLVPFTGIDQEAIRSYVT